MKRSVQIPMPLVLGLVLVLATQLVSCEKDPPPPPVIPEELMPTLELTVTPEGIRPYGEVATLKWKTINALRLFINEERQDNYKEGNKGTGKLFKNATYVVKASNVKLFVEKEVTIQVGDWTTSTFGLVSYYPWRYKALSISSLDGKIIDYWIPDPEVLIPVYYFHRDGTMNSDRDVAKVAWYLSSQNSIIINGATRKLEVTKEEMILSYQTTFNNQPVWFNMIYEHASDTPTDPE